MDSSLHLIWQIKLTAKGNPKNRPKAGWTGILKNRQEKPISAIQVGMTVKRDSLKFNRAVE